MNNFHVSLVANISFSKQIDCSLLSSTFKTRLVLEGGYSDKLIVVSLNPILGANAKNQQGYRKNEFLYSIVITGSATANSALQLGQKLKHTLDKFTKTYANSYFLYSMYVERADRKDFCVQTSQEEVFHG